MCPVFRTSVLATFFVVALAVAPKSVHLALETFIHIEPQEVNDTHKIVRKISNFLDDLKHALQPARRAQIRSETQKHKKYLTNFLIDVTNAILNFGYARTQRFFQKLHEEMKSYFDYKGSAFADFIKSPRLRQHILETLKKWSETNPFKMKLIISNYVKRTKNVSGNRLNDLLNHYYDQNDEVTMKKLVGKLKKCTKARDFGKVIQEIINTLIIQRYDSMDYTVRKNITNEINRLYEHLIQRRFVSNGTTTTVNFHKVSVPVNTVTDKNDSIIDIHPETTKVPREETKHWPVPKISGAKNQNDLSSSSVEVLKLNYSNPYAPIYTEAKTIDKKENVPFDIKQKAANVTVLQDINYKMKITNMQRTKRRLKKITKNVPITDPPIKLKRFKLKIHPDRNNTKNRNTTSAPHDIKEGTSKNNYVPNDIINSTHGITSAVAHNITSENLSQDIYNGTSNNTHLALRVNTEVPDILTDVPQDIGIKNTVLDLSTNVPQAVRNKNDIVKKFWDRFPEREPDMMPSNSVTENTEIPNDRKPLMRGRQYNTMNPEVPQDSHDLKLIDPYENNDINNTTNEPHDPQNNDDLKLTDPYENNDKNNTTNKPQDIHDLKLIDAFENNDTEHITIKQKDILELKSTDTETTVKITTTTPYVPQDLRGVKLTTEAYENLNRDEYVPPSTELNYAELGFTPREILDIEERIDRMHIE